MKKKSLLMYLLIFVVMLLGGMKAGLAVSFVELMLQAPKKKLEKRGLLGVILAMGLSFIMPLLLRRVFSRGARPKSISMP
ncbi:MAG TPA: hypothetical protein VMC61_06380 [Methanocella sp.]|nr:hypothetical protein [Methanocella sp.]